MCLSCICLLAMHTLICVTFSLPPGVRSWLRLLLVALPGLFCLPYCIQDKMQVSQKCTDKPRMVLFEQINKQYVQYARMYTRNSVAEKIDLFISPRYRLACKRLPKPSLSFSDACINMYNLK